MFEKLPESGKELTIGTFRYEGETIHRWLDIDSFVLRKGRRGKA
jgi:hypothetical protein